MFFKGLLLPFENRSCNNDEESYIIVGFLPKHSFCFSTKARVPTKISVECVKVKDCFNWSNYITKEDDLFERESIHRKDEQLVPLLNFLENKKSEIFESKSANDEYDQSKLKLYFEELKVGSITSETNTTNQSQILDIKTEDERQKDDKKTSSEILNPFGTDIEELESQIKRESMFAKFPSYKIFHFIAKADDDLRQELMILQIISKCKEIFEAAGIPIILKPYTIEVTSSTSGLIEFLPNTNSIDGIKKLLPPNSNLKTFYKLYFRNNYDDAQINFTRSLAGYSLISYILQIKDRHNGNILIDKLGHIIHIDFGFVLGISPGNLNFESAPFKFTNEYLDILETEYFVYYKALLLRGFLELKKHMDYIVNLTSIMSNQSKMPCFATGEKPEIIISKLKERFHMYKSEVELKNLIEDLVHKSLNNFWTNRYDSFQYITNGIKY